MSETWTNPMTCSKCLRVGCAVLIDGRCAACDPFHHCPACCRGTLQPDGTPAWQNRYTCDECGHHESR